MPAHGGGNLEPLRSHERARRRAEVHIVGGLLYAFRGRLAVSWPTNVEHDPVLIAAVVRHWPTIEGLVGFAIAVRRVAEGFVETSSATSGGAG